jgi:hypothetical protein
VIISGVIAGHTQRRASDKPAVEGKGAPPTLRCSVTPGMRTTAGAPANSGLVPRTKPRQRCARHLAASN